MNTQIQKQEWFRTAYGKTYLQYLSPTREGVDTKKLVNLIPNLLQLPPDAHILDLACGQGRHANLLAKNGFSVTGVDINTEALKRAQKVAEKLENTPRYIHADIRSLPLTQSFDAVLNLFTSLGYMSSQEEELRVLREARRVTRSTGRILLDLVNPVLPITGRETRVWTTLRGYTILEERTYNPLTGISTSIRKVAEDDTIQPIVTHIRIFTLAEMNHMLNSAGYVITDICGDYAGGQYQPNVSPRLLIAATAL